MYSHGIHVRNTNAPSSRQRLGVKNGGKFLVAEKRTFYGIFFPFFALCTVSGGLIFGAFVLSLWAGGQVDKTCVVLFGGYYCNITGAY